MKITNNQLKQIIKEELSHGFSGKMAKLHGMIDKKSKQKD